MAPKKSKKKRVVTNDLSDKLGEGLTSKLNIGDVSTGDVDTSITSQETPRVGDEEITDRKND